jgi:hypothetical protein
LTRRSETLLQRGPIIRDLTVPDEELALRPGRLRGPRRAGRWLRRLFGTALIAWTLGLAVATSGFLHNGGARSSAVPERPAKPARDIIIPLPELPIRSEFR